MKKHKLSRLVQLNFNSREGRDIAMHIVEQTNPKPGSNEYYLQIALAEAFGIIDGREMLDKIKNPTVGDFVQAFNSLDNETPADI